MAYGIEVYGPDNDTTKPWLSITDNLTTFYEMIVAVYSGTQQIYYFANQNIPLTGTFAIELVNGSISQKKLEITYVYPTGRALKVTSVNPQVSRTCTFVILGDKALVS